MKHSAWIVTLCRRRTALLAVLLGVGLLGIQATYTLHVLQHVHLNTVPTGHLPAADRDCVVLHAGGLPEVPLAADRPVLPVAIRLQDGPERPPAVPAVDAPIARAPPVPLVTEA